MRAEGARALAGLRSGGWPAEYPVRNQGPGRSLSGPDAGHPLHGAGGHGGSIHDPEYARNDLGGGADSPARATAPTAKPPGRGRQPPQGAPAGRYAQLRDSTELTVSSRQLARVRGMAAITATSTSSTDSSVSLDVRPFPASYLIPAGTTTSADFCPVRPHLTMRAAGAATTQHNRHPGRPPRTRTTNSPLRPPRIRDDPVDGDGLYLLEQAHPDRPAFYAVRVPGE